MKLKYKLEEIDTKEKETKFITSYIYKAVDKQYDGLSPIRVGGENSKQILENLGLPDSVGDVIEVDFSPKQTQSRLSRSDDVGVQDKGKARRSRA